VEYLRDDCELQDMFEAFMESSSMLSQGTGCPCAMLPVFIVSVDDCGKSAV